MRTPITLLVVSFFAVAFAGAAPAGDMDENLNSLHLELKDKLAGEIERDVARHLAFGPAAPRAPGTKCDLAASLECGPRPGSGPSSDAIAIIDPDPVGIR